MDAVSLSVASAALTGIAEEMGTVLVRSSLSANIKERRDCSAALFDARGRMVAQAEHIPVHLGAMPESVAAVIAHDPQPGETWILNDPFAGGSHLPDITMVTALDGAFAVHPRAPLRRRRDHARLAARDLDVDLAGGRDRPARAAHRRGARSAARQRSHARDPARRPRRAGGGEPRGGRASPRAAVPARGGLRRRDRLRGAPRTRGDRAAAQRPLRGGGRGRDGGRPADPCRGHRRRTITS